MISNCSRKVYRRSDFYLFIEFPERGPEHICIEMKIAAKRLSRIFQSAVTKEEPTEKAAVITQKPKGTLRLRTEFDAGLHGKLYDSIKRKGEKKPKYNDFDLMALSKDVLHLLMAYLDVKDLQKLAQTCTFWYHQIMFTSSET